MRKMSFLSADWTENKANSFIQANYLWKLL